MIRKLSAMTSLSFLLVIGSSCGKSTSGEMELKNTVCAQCHTIQSAAALQALNLQPGDTVMMKSGEWTDQELIFDAQGTSQQPIVLRAEQPGAVMMSGTSSVSIRGKWLVVSGLVFQNGFTSGKNVVDFTSSSSNCRLTNTAIVDYNPPTATTDYRWVSINGSSHRIDHCYLKGKSHQGPTMVVWGTSKPMKHRIDHNFFGERAAVPDNGGETIRLGTSDWSMTDAFTTIEDNIFQRCNGETEIISNKMGADTIRNNFFHESQGTLCLRHGNGSAVYGNYFVGNGIKETGGIRIIGEDHLVYNNYFQNMAGTGQRAALVLMDGVPNSPLSGYFQVKRVQVVANTMINCKQSFDIGSGKGGSNRTLPPMDGHIANNVVLQIPQSILLTFTDQPLNFVYQGNIVFDVPTGQQLPAGFVRLDPQYAITTDGIYEPTSSSQVLGAFVGNYPFAAAADAGAPKLDSKHRELLKAQNIGPGFMTGLGSSLVINP
ncbi:alginate lyase [Sphingobacterium sp. N143]|uniref:polysaccharide lyase 6 family protein n=1 Tax=Sphingobacterium sp. N143 TaxID=2746727 RepID=UPI002576AB48|nr:polysaccharide lyase 6 family protein [Sphingobacterium sp. N143]MDM1296219.1 alginate lyase [Sphingobacterium sp. N143]